MKRFGWLLTLLLFLPALGLGRSFSASPESVLILEGDSTLHAYHSTATVLSAQAEIQSFQPIRLTSLRVEIPVQEMKSGKSGLDKNMVENLKGKDHPLIIFNLSDFSGNGSTVTARGDLTVAGVTKSIELTAQAEPGEDRVRFTGKKELLMTDFGIKPPKMFLGAVKTANEVTIHFNLVLQ